jgi:hypothetical protein
MVSPRPDLVIGFVTNVTGPACGTVRRKAGATRAAENGASVHTLKSMFGWQTLKQAENYTKSADQKRLAAAGMQLLGRGK